MKWRIISKIVQILYQNILRILIVKDKKAAKLIIKRAKKHPELYTESEIKYAKMVRRRIKREERDAERRLLEDSSE